MQQANDEQGQWAWLLVGATALAPSEVSQLVEDDLDFLDAGPAEPPVQVPLRRAESERWHGARALAHGLLADELGSQVLSQQADPRLADLDEAAAWWLLRALADRPGVVLAERGELARLTQRALLSHEIDVVTQACRVVLQAPLPHLQPELVTALQHLIAAMAPAEAIDVALQALELVGDGRCVRPMEALLADRPTGWSDHQAWRARHIVQVIRRGGRR
jgi:hypothetical protein